MTLFWGRDGNLWTPQGGRCVPWADLAAGDLIMSHRRPWRVLEVRAVPVIDWDEHDRAYYDRACEWPRSPASEETWDRRPVYLIVVPADGGKRHHVKRRPYAYGPAYVIPEHYPVCRECGELYPCRELEIRAEAAREMKELDKYEKVLPGTCWGCFEPITHRQDAIRFEGENLFLPGAPQVVFHARRSKGCRSAAISYEERWVKAGEGRRPRLSCPGKLVIHVDGAECSEDPHCPGPEVQHRAGFINHTRYEEFRCLRCADARVRGETVQTIEPPAGPGLLRLGGE